MLELGVQTMSDDEFIEIVVRCEKCENGIIFRALKGKQTPKNPKKQPHFSVHPHFHFYSTNHCPSCGKMVKKYDNEHIYPHHINNYCSRCGQALDWGQYNE